MKRCAPFDHGAPGLYQGNLKLFLENSRRRGFTLLEMCIVLFIIMLLLAAALPAIQTAFVEQSVRRDSHELALMVKTAMMQSADQHRAYIIELTRSSMMLHPASQPSPEGDSAPPAGNSDDASATGDNSAPENIDITHSIDSLNRVLLPDPEKPRAWLPAFSSSWLFQPGALCPAPRVRISRGNAWIELSFNPLTGNVEDEAAYFP